MSIRKRLDGITKIPEQYLSLTPPAPKSVKIELTSRCNYKCSYCPVVCRKEQHKADMDWSLFEKITCDMKANGVEEIGVFLIGEPFMNFDLLLKAIKFLKKDLAIPYVFITSNGSMASPARVLACMSAGLDSLKWSCNVADNLQFASMMNVPVNLFNLARANIREAKSIRDLGKYKTKLYASSIWYDDNQPIKMRSFLEKDILPFVDEHYWLPLYTMGGVAIEREQKLGFIPTAGNSGRLDSPVPPIHCWTLFTAGHVLSDGRMTACCGDGSGYWTIGDLKTQTLMEAWHSQDFQELRQAHISNNIIGTKCEKCALFGAEVALETAIL